MQRKSFHTRQSARARLNSAALWVSFCLVLTGCKMKLLSTHTSETTDDGTVIVTPTGTTTHTTNIVKPTPVQPGTATVTGGLSASVTLARETTEGNILIVGVNDDAGPSYTVSSISDDAASGGNTYVTANALSTGTGSFADYHTEIWYA